MAIPDAKERLLEQNGRIPTATELAAELGVSEEHVLEALEGGRGYNAYSLDVDPSESDGEEARSMDKYLGDEEKGYEDIEMAEVLETVMADLSDRERTIMRKRLLNEMTQREVASSLGLSQMTVSRIEKAMRKKFLAEYER
jgi:RNA polymerase sigma-B factor